MDSDIEKKKPSTHLQQQHYKREEKIMSVEDKVRYYGLLLGYPGICLGTLGVNLGTFGQFWTLLSSPRYYGHNSPISESTLIGTHCIFIIFILLLKSGILLVLKCFVDIYSVFCFKVLTHIVDI